MQIIEDMHQLFASAFELTKWYEFMKFAGLFFTDHLVSK